MPENWVSVAIAPPKSQRKPDPLDQVPPTKLRRLPRKKSIRNVLASERGWASIGKTTMFVVRLRPLADPAKGDAAPKTTAPATTLQADEAIELDAPSRWLKATKKQTKFGRFARKIPMNRGVAGDVDDVVFANVWAKKMSMTSPPPNR